MSLECSECEHDLRGGHATTCSRSKGWIKCNLPWVYYSDGRDSPQAPDLKREVLKAFHTNETKEYRKLTCMLGNAKWGTAKYDEITSSKEYKAEQKKYKKFCDKVRVWREIQPAWTEYKEKYIEWEKANNQKSFCGRKLNQPGTLIEILDDKKLKYFMIGDINILGGVCDDCMGFSKDAIVARYKVLGA